MINVDEVGAVPDRCVLGTALAMSTEVAVEVGDHSDVGPPGADGQWAASHMHGQEGLKQVEKEFNMYFFYFFLHM